MNPPSTTSSAPLNQYPNGTDLLWMAHYRSSPEKGDMDGGKLKIDGTAEEAMAYAQRHAEESGQILQCLRRRY